MDGAMEKVPTLTQWDLMMLNGVGDLIDLRRALFPEERPDINTINSTALEKLKHESGHCSVRVLMIKNSSKIFVISDSHPITSFGACSTGLRRYVYGPLELVLLRCYEPYLQALPF